MGAKTSRLIVSDHSVNKVTDQAALTQCTNVLQIVANQQYGRPQEQTVNKVFSYTLAENH